MGFIPIVAVLVIAYMIIAGYYFGPAIYEEIVRWL